MQNNFSKLFSGKWTVLSINIMETKMCVCVCVCVCIMS